MESLRGRVAAQEAERRVQAERAAEERRAELADLKAERARLTRGAAQPELVAGVRALDFRIAELEPGGR